MKILGVDIGTNSIKIAELDVSSKGSVLTNFSEYPLSPDPQKDQTLERHEILRRVSSQTDPLNTRWVIAVPQARVSVHNKRFPFRERAKILKSLAHELEDDIPFDIDETIFDAKIIESFGPFADVLTVACPNEGVKEMLEIANDGGFDPEVVSVEGLALANLFENWEVAPPEKPAPMEIEGTGVHTGHSARVILQMGHTRTNMLVYREGSLIAVRSLQWGGKEIADALSQAFGVPIFEAIKILKERAFILMNSAGATKDQLLLSRTVSLVVDQLLRDLRLTLLEMRASFNLNYEKIELTGGVSQIQNLGAYITQGLEVPANIAHPLESLRSSRIEASPGIEAVSALAIGLAIEGAKRPRNPAINLRQGDFARENESIRRFWETWRVPAQVAFAAFVLFFIFAVTRDFMASSLSEKMDERLQTVAKEDAGLKGSAADENGLRHYISQQKKKIQDREALQKAEHINSAMDIVARLSEKLPLTRPPMPGKGLDVTRLVINNSTVEISGRIQTPGGVALIERALNDLAKTKTVKPAPTGVVPPGPGQAFAYTMQVERVL